MSDSTLSSVSDETSFDYAIPDFFAVADRFVELYVSYRRRYVMMINGSIFIPKKKDSGNIPLTNSIVCKHLHKRFSIGVFAGAHSSKFVCFDVDDGNQETVRKILSLAEQFGIPKEYIYVSSSGGKGYHVEVFFDSLIYTEKLRIFYDWVIINGHLDPNKVEFRPTASQAIKLPLSRHAKTGNICWYVNQETFEPYTYDAYVLEIQQYSSVDFNSLVDSCGLRKPISGGYEDELIARANPNNPTSRTPTQQELHAILSTSTYPDITRTGERHMLTRAIAIHNRQTGMSLEESEAALLDWWKVQDKELTTTSDEEAIADIRDLVAWTFSESFVVPCRTKRLEVTQDLLRVALSMNTKTAKKLMFLIGCYCSVYGRMNMGYERIAKHIRCSAISVRNLMSELVSEGYVHCVSSKPSYSDGKYMRKPNTYYITEEAVEGTKDLTVRFVSDKPLIYEAKEVQRSDESGRTKTVIPELEPENFTDFYYRIIRTMVCESSYKDYFSRSEIKALDDIQPYPTN